MSTLDEQLNDARRNIFTDSYPMSIGELTNVYAEGDLIIRPPFQRLFRWNDDQKSRLIESILIGIPLPSIFVAQDEEGRWELVDGLQRISTILQLQGLLDKQIYPQLTLIGTKYLPSLDGLVWDSSDDSVKSLTPAQRRDIKRAKIDLKIVQRGSDPKTKFDLFQRLNSFGSDLSTQEIRNAQLVGVNPEFVEWLGELANYQPFTRVVRLADSQLEQKYNEELVLRFLYLHKLDDQKLKRIRNFQDSLESFSIDLALNFSPDYKERATAIFHKTFGQLADADPKILGRWNSDKQGFGNKFLNSSFEGLAVPLGHMLAAGEKDVPNLRNAAIQFWSLPDMTTRFATGQSTETRLKRIVPAGRKILES